MQGKAVLVLGAPSGLGWTRRLPALVEAAGIVGHRLDVTDDADVAEQRLRAATLDVLAVCDGGVIASPTLDRLVEAAATNRRFHRVLVEETTGDRPTIDALASRIGFIELRFGRPLGWLVRTGEVPPGEHEAQLWLRSIYAPSALDPAELPPHEAHAVYWDEVRRDGEARPPRD